jgi:hypothetical protein
MRIDSITSNTFGAGIFIKSCDNKGRTFLYNEIKDLTNELQIPGNFRTTEIELPSVSDVVLAKLKKLGINFIVPKEEKI